MKHVEIYRRPGRYAGWPANYGLWSWGDDIVVGFTAGYMKADPEEFHPVDRERPQTPMVGMSKDGGETWVAAPAPLMVPGAQGLSAGEHRASGARGDRGGDGKYLRDCPGGVDFAAPDFAMWCARSKLGKDATSWFYVSTDRARTWSAPFRFPDFGTNGIAARTDYIVIDKDTCLVFVTGKMHEAEGRVLCARTTDGGRTFERLSLVGPEPDGYSIMPSSVRLPDGEIVVAVRRKSANPPDGCGNCWIETFRSQDTCVSWKYGGVAVEDTGRGGNPPAMIRLSDGRLCLTYGYRNAPYGIRARTSEDGGRTWSSDIVLRDDGGNHDIGYPRTAQRADGKIVTVYYYNDDPDGERYIAATIWDV